MTSFLANAFVLKKDNPKEGESLRNVQAEFKRNPDGGFFMLVWKTIMAGALKRLEHLRLGSWHTKHFFG